MSLDSHLYQHNIVHRRSGHIAVCYKGHLIVWGGYMEDSFNSAGQLQYHSEYHTTSDLWIFDPLKETWHRILTKGDIPPRTSGACGILNDDFLYIFAGYHGTDDPGSLNGNSNLLYRLHIPSKTWEWLHPSGIEPIPCDKLVGWPYKNKIYYFGGFGPAPQMQMPFLHVIDDTTPTWLRRGWNNQLVCYNMETNAWEWPKTKNSPPCPRAAHASDICNGKAYIFGGRFKNTRMNDLYCLNLETLEWSENLNEGLTDIPCGRSWHSFTFVSPNHAVIYGGLNQHNTVLSDCWFLSLPQLKWQKTNYENNECRLWHVARVVNSGQLIIVGGHKENVLNPNLRKEHAEHLVIINFSPKSLLRLCIDALAMYQDAVHVDLSMVPSNIYNILSARYFQDSLQLP